jgi:hypothetical protein
MIAFSTVLMALQMEDTQLIPKTLSSGVVRFSVPNDYT